MKNVLLYLANAYYTIIRGANIQLNGVAMPVYDGIAPSTELGSYILISVDRSAQQTEDKCGFMWDANILVDIVVKDGSFGFVDSDTIAEQIGELINTQLNPTVDNFQCFATQSSFNNLSGLNPTEPTFRTLLRNTHKIVQSQ